MILQGSSVILRPFKQGDEQHTLLWRGDSELRRLAQFHFFPITEYLEKEWIESILHSKSDKDLSLAIDSKKDRKLIGYLQIKHINWISRIAWLGILIGDMHERGKGYGKEALKLGLNYCFDILNLRKISLEVLKENMPAISLYNKYGFQEEGILKDQFYFEGKYYDVSIMGLLREVYEQLS